MVLVGYAIAVLGFFSLARPVYDQPLSFSEALPYLSIGISGLVGLGFSFALLFDEARHRLWEYWSSCRTELDLTTTSPSSSSLLLSASTRPSSYPDGFGLWLTHFSWVLQVP